MIASDFLNAYRRVVLERATPAIVPNRLSTETLGKMPELRRMPTVPFGRTRQTLPVLLDSPGRPDDSPIETTGVLIREDFVRERRLARPTEIAWATAAAGIFRIGLGQLVCRRSLPVG